MNKLFNVTRSLTLKVAMGATLVMLIVLAVFTGVFVASERQKAEEVIFQNGKTFANFSAQAIYNSYSQFYTHPQSDNFNTFKSEVGTIKDYNKDIDSVELLSLNGRILFSSAEFKDGRYSGPARTVTDNATLDGLKQSSVTTRSLDEAGNKFTEIIVPLQEVGGGHIFSMRYLLSYGSLSSRVDQVYQRIVLVDFMLLLFAVAIAVLAASRLANPIIRLTKVAEQIRTGNFDARTPNASGDELGQLGGAINEMASKLKGYYENLEAKVKERTNAMEIAQNKLIQNIQQDDALLASIADGVIATDRDGHIVLMNQAASDTLQLDKLESIGKPYESIWHLETEKGEAINLEQQPEYEALHKSVQVKSSKFYYARRDKDGKPIVQFAVAVSISPVIAGGHMLGIINVFRNITHEKQVDRMKTEFISLASHQLRTPLSAIRWFSEMLLSGDAGELTPDQKDFVQNVYGSAERMIELVNALLNISRIESGRIIVAPKPTDLNELVGGVVKDLKAKIDAKQQNLVISIHNELPKINLDPHLIGQVYMNFLSNAVKYTPKGGEVSVFISRKGDELVSQITDNGYGIPKAQQGRVFEKFFRAENAVKVETDGTGLGLYLVKSIIESSGGRVWFESEEGKGTTFWFSLPMTGMQAHKGEVTLEVPTDVGERDTE